MAQGCNGVRTLAKVNEICTMSGEGVDELGERLLLLISG